jgi:hypothetical protein
MATRSWVLRACTTATSRAGVLQSRAVRTTTFKAPVITMRRALATSRARLTSFGSGRRAVLRRISIAMRMRRILSLERKKSLIDVHRPLLPCVLAVDVCARR